MDQPSQKPSKKRYYIETITDNSSSSFYVTEGYQGKAVMLFNQESFGIISESGWMNEKHQGFLKIEISKDEKSVLVYYRDEEKPKIMAIPPAVKIEQGVLTENSLNKILAQMKEKGLTFFDTWSEYYDGAASTYSYDPVKKYYKVVTMDTVAGAFIDEVELSVSEIKAKLLKYASLYDLTTQGFEL